jgi:hypothetical protein
MSNLREGEIAKPSVIFDLSKVWYQLFGLCVSEAVEWAKAGIAIVPDW